MAFQYVFKRHEVKYLLARDQVDLVKRAMQPHMRPDEHGRSTLCNVYFDTPDHLLIRRSIEHPLYKEKLRIRSYGAATPTTSVFVEIKKKYDRIVYKRRISTTEPAAMAYLCDGVPLPASPRQEQIVRELDYFLQRYRILVPAVFLSYEREAFFSQTDRNFRVTFDDAILWRETDLSLAAGPGGERILDEGRVLMEIKAGGAYPLWMSAFLSEQGIFPGKFSKYGSAYRFIEEREQACHPHLAGGLCA